MKYLLLGLFAFNLGNTSQAATYFGFCWAQKTSGVYCNQIAFSASPVLQNFICKNFALSIGSTDYGSKRNTDKNALIQDQEDGCNYVNNQPKYTCFLEERCEISGSVTSSLSLTHRSVFSATGDSELARQACIAQHPQNYLDALSSAPTGCLIGAKAVMTLP